MFKQLLLRRPGSVCLFFRGISRRQYAFSIHPIPGSGLTERSSRPGAWMAKGDKPRFALEPISGKWPNGWVLFDSRLAHRHTADCTATLYFDVGNGVSDDHALVIPVTRKGTIHELIFLPPGLVGLQWSPIGCAGSFEQAPIMMTEVGTLERIYRMARRVADMLKTQPEDRLNNLNLGYWRMLFDLRGAYSAAGIIRSYTPPLKHGRWMERRWENGIETVRIHGDAIIAMLEQAAASLFLQSDSGCMGPQKDLTLVRQYLLPHLIGQYRQSYSSICIVVKISGKQSFIPEGQAGESGLIDATSPASVGKDAQKIINEKSK